MRVTRFIPSGGEDGSMMRTDDSGPPRFGLVLVGCTAADMASWEARFAGRRFVISRVDVDAATGVDAGLAQMRSAMDAIRADALSGARVGVAGYRDGGRFAYLAATRLGADAAVAFLGAGIAAHLDEAHRARVPMSLHFSDDDPRVPIADIRAIKGALEGIGCIDIYRYQRFDAAARELAELRAMEVLAGVLARDEKSDVPLERTQDA